MFYIDLIHILALLVTLSALSGMIKTRKTDRPYYNLVWQGLLFGSMAVLGMIHPLTLQPGLFFDGGSVILSLCGLFFGYVSVGIASSMAIFCRLLQGGIGTLMGIIVIVSSAVIGLLTQRYLKQHQEFSIPHLWCFGLLVHIAMLLATLALPSDLITETLKTISLPVLIFYPIATVFAGKVILDQLARSRMINELTASEEELISTLYSLGDALICTNVDGIIHHMNPEAEHLTGWTVAEATGQRLESIFKLSTPGMLKQPENPTQRILRAGQAVTLSQNMMLISKNGKFRPIVDRSSPIRNSAGQVLGVAIVFRDQTREKTAEASLREAERQWKSTFNATNDAICLLDENHRIIRCNQAMILFCNVKESDLIGKLCWTVVHQTSKPIPDCPIAKMVISKKRERTELQIGDGIYEVTADPVFDEAGKLEGAIHIIRNLSDRKQAEESLRRIQWMLTKKPENQTYPPFNYGTLVDLNSKGLILQSVGRDVLQQIAEDHMRLLDTSSAIYEADGSYAFEISSSNWYRRLNHASRVMCDTSDDAEAVASGLWICHEDSWTACARKAIEQGNPVDIDARTGNRLYSVPILANAKAIGAITFSYGDPPRDDDTLSIIAKRFQINASLLKQDALTYSSRPPYIIEMAKERVKTSAQIIGLLVEIKQAHAQQEALKQQLLQTQKMDSINRLASGIAHDFNNNLQSILGRTEILVNNTSLTAEQSENLSEISKAALRSADLTQQLLTLASKQPITPKVLDVNASIENEMIRLKPLVGESIQIQWTPSSSALSVKMDPSQLTQILTILTTRAKSAITQNGNIKIETNKTVFDEASQSVNQNISTGTYVEMTFSDNGKGLDAKACERIFEPYFGNTNAREGSSGLGLATVHGIVHQNGGFITVQSNVSQGSIFKVYIPLYVEKKRVRQKAPPSYNNPRGTETILFVEDDENLLTLGKMQLQELGYTVLSTLLADSAIGISKDFPGVIDLLLTDVIMPEMNGVELSKRIKQQRPDIKRLFMSGYTADIMDDSGEINLALNFLQKPFSSHDLAEKLRAILDKNPKDPDQDEH